MPRVNDTGGKFALAYLLVGSRLEWNWLHILRIKVQTILNASLAAMSAVIVVAHLVMMSAALIHHVHLLMVVGIARMVVVMMVLTYVGTVLAVASVLLVDVRSLLLCSGVRNLLLVRWKWA